MTATGAQPGSWDSTGPRGLDRTKTGHRTGTSAGEDWTGPEPDKGERITGQGPTGPAGHQLPSRREHTSEQALSYARGPLGTEAQSLRDQRGPKGCRQRPLSSRRTRLRLVVGSELHCELESLLLSHKQKLLPRRFCPPRKFCNLLGRLHGVPCTPIDDQRPTLAGEAAARSSITGGWARQALREQHCV